MRRLTKLRVLFAALACSVPCLVIRVPARAAAPAGRYTVNGGTVIDSKTKLTWQQTPASSTMNLASAQAYCASTSVSAALGGTGWRVPTLKELMTLVDTSVPVPGPVVDLTYFANGPSNAFLSSTVVTNGSSVHMLSVSYASGGINDGSTTGSVLSVRCVR